MRHSSVSCAVIAAALLVLAPSAAPAATPEPQSAASIDRDPVVGPARASSSSTGPTAAVRIVTLPTGERVSLAGAPGQERVSVLSTATGPARSLITERSGAQTYAFPMTVQPYLGTVIDRELFNVSRLAAAVGDRQPVQITYRGSGVPVPGITAATASAGTAGGYLTPASAAAFGRAVAEQWKADRLPGHPRRSALFPGVAKISVAGPVSAGTSGQTQISAAEAKFPLVVKVMGADGAPAGFSALTLMDVTDGRKVHASTTVDQNGVAHISVPKGTYSAISYASGFDPESGRPAGWLTSVNEFKITNAGRTMTIDHRKATVRAGEATVPKPVDRTFYSFNWIRSDARARPYTMEFAVAFTSDDVLFLAPSTAAKVGRLAFLQSWALSQPVLEPTYTYHLATRNPAIPATAGTRFTASGLGTITAGYYGDGRAGVAQLIREPMFSGSLTSLGMELDVKRGTRRIEYVGSRGGKMSWSEMVTPNLSALDSGALYGPGRTIGAGDTQSVNWFKGPLGAAVPWYPGLGGCSTACRSRHQMRLHLTPFADSFLTHQSGLATMSASPAPISRFRLYRNGKRIVNVVDDTGGYGNVPAGKSTYRAIFDMDRRLMAPVQSTRSKTELSFVSAGSDEQWRALPIVQARLALPLRLDGTVAATRSSVTVSVAQIQFAAKSASTSASLQVRPAGEAWTTVKLKAIGGGKYQGTLDSSTLAGLNVDVRFTGANKAGSTFRQTVLKAYTVAAN